MNLNKPNSSNPLPHPRFTVCHRHPGEPITGFCAACLSERLAGLDPDGIKSIVEIGQSSKSIELSRSKSCSSHNGCKRNGVVISSTTVEPRRKSCDVRGRNSLSSLFDMDDGSRKGGRFMDVSGGGLRFGKEVEDLGVGEIRVSEQVPICGDEDEWRTMKEHLDLESRRKTMRKTMSKSKDLKNIAGSIWIAAASGFSKKLQQWKQKQQKIRTSRNDDVNLNRVAMEVERVNVSNLRQWRERETQSEVGDYGFGRRSCDTEPRFSVDAVRASVDCSRLDEGRASWDGYLIGRSSVTRPNRMLTVVKDDDDDDDDQFVEEVISLKSGNGIDKSPGGTEQTRDYYGEGLRRSRRSFDRSSSNRKASSVELEELRAISNSKISPATVELFHGAKVLLTKNDVKLPNLSPIKTDRMESSDSLSIGPSSIVDDGNRNNKFHVKKLAGWRKAWTNWGGLSQKQADPKFKFTCEEYNEESKATEKVTSSGTHVSSSSSSSISGSFMRSSTETKFSRLKQQEQPFTLERNKSTRYSPSPNNHDNSLLRFYLTPSRGIRSGNCSKAKSRLQSSQDVARNALRL